METTKLFRKDFTLVVIGQIISLFGNAILRFALPLYLLRTTGSATLFGIVSASSFIPMIVLSLLGGVLADRVNKRNIMVWLDFMTAGIITVFFLVLDLISIVPLFIVVLMLLYGISGTYQPTVQASIPVLVADTQLLPANAVINQISALAALLGPVIGGMLYGAWGLTPILIISIFCFVFSAVMELFIKIPYTKRENKDGMAAIIKTDLQESYHFVKTEKPVFLRVVALICGFNLVLSALLIVGSPVLIVEILGMSDAMLGASQGMFALGGLAGGILTALLSKKLKLEKSHYILIFCAFAVGIMGVTMLMKPSDLVCYLVITMCGFSIMVTSTLFSVQMLSVVQAQTPGHLVGEVIACVIALSMCAQPIGQSIYGFLLDYYADRSWIVLLGAAAASLAIGIYSKRVFLELKK